MITYLQVFQQFIQMPPEDLPLYALEYLSDAANHEKLWGFLWYVQWPEIRNIISDMLGGDELNLPPSSSQQVSTVEAEEEVIGNVGNTKLTERRKRQLLLDEINCIKYLQQSGIYSCSYTPTVYTRPCNSEPPLTVESYVSPPPGNQLQIQFLDQLKQEQSHKENHSN